MSRSALLFTVATVIGQLKWPWILGQRTLIDLQTFDDASRGPLGCIKLLTTRVGLSFTLLGAIITIGSLAFDPFLQQLVGSLVIQSYQNSSLAFTSQGNGFAMNPLSQQFEAAIYAGLYSNPSSFDPKPACPTGNCVWPTYGSIGWCSKCQNFTSNAVVRDCDFNLSIIANSLRSGETQTLACRVEFADGNQVQTPITITQNTADNTTFDIIETQLNFTSISTLDGPYISSQPTSSFLGIKAPQLAMGYASIGQVGPEGPDVPVRQFDTAYECILDLCVREYNVSMSGGVPNVQIVGTHYGNKFTRNLTVDSMSRPFWCWSLSDPDDLDFNFTVAAGNSAYTYRFATTVYFVDNRNFSFCSPWEYTNWGDNVALLINTTSASGFQYNVNNSSGGTLDESGMDVSEQSTGIINLLTSNVSLEGIFSNIASSLTQLTLETTAVNITGQVSFPIILIKIYWKWLLLPITLEVMAIILLLYAMVHTKLRKVPLWKSSSLALLYHGLTDDGKDKLEINKLSKMELDAKDVKVRLVFNNGWFLKKIE